VSKNNRCSRRKSIERKREKEKEKKCKKKVKRGRWKIRSEKGRRKK
jgi:hypothetical protein